jgi:hypothetical protein
MLPFQIARAIQTYFAPRAENARPTVVISSEVACLAVALCEGSETSAGAGDLICSLPVRSAFGLPVYVAASLRMTAKEGGCCRYAASSSSWREIPRNSKRRINVSSIKLFGHDAPAVIPMTAGPFGNQKWETTSRFSCKL